MGGPARRPPHHHSERVMVEGGSSGEAPAPKAPCDASHTRSYAPSTPRDVHKVHAGAVAVVNGGELPHKQRGHGGGNEGHSVARGPGLAVSGSHPHDLFGPTCTHTGRSSGHANRVWHKNTHGRLFCVHWARGAGGRGGWGKHLKQCAGKGPQRHTIGYHTTLAPLTPPYTPTHSPPHLHTCIQTSTHTHTHTHCHSHTTHPRTATTTPTPRHPHHPTPASHGGTDPPRPLPPPGSP